MSINLNQKGPKQPQTAENSLIVYTAQPKLNIPGFNEKITLTKQSKSPLPGVVVIFVNLVNLARF